jgi:hypothetical protein
MKWPAVLLPLLAAGVLAWSGCGQKTDLKKQIDGLEKVFPGLTAAVAAQTEATAQPAPGDAKACVVTALSAVRRNDFATGVILLHKSVQVPGLSAEQIMAVSDVRRAWVIDLTKRAARGDESAKAALAAIEDAR